MHGKMIFSASVNTYVALDAVEWSSEALHPIIACLDCRDCFFNLSDSPIRVRSLFLTSSQGQPILDGGRTQSRWTDTPWGDDLGGRVLLQHILQGKKHLAKSPESPWRDPPWTWPPFWRDHFFCTSSDRRCLTETLGKRRGWGIVLAPPTGFVGWVLIDKIYVSEEIKCRRK